MKISKILTFKIKFTTDNPMANLWSPAKEFQTSLFVKLVLQTPPTAKSQIISMTTKTPFKTQS